MTSKKNKLRAAKMAMRKHKKRPNPLTPEKIEYIDYKDVNLLQRFMSDRSKLRARRMTGANTQQQRDIATAVKNAREMALLPYTKRVAAVRGPRSRDDRRDGADATASYAEVVAETAGDITVTTPPENVTAAADSQTEAV
jgi:small subunit ribosomal protein S18